MADTPKPIWTSNGQTVLYRHGDVEQIVADNAALREALQFIAGHDLNGADDRARAIICGLFIIKAKKALEKP